MRKTIIIDDRPERKKLHLSEDSISQLEKLVERDILTLSDGEGYESDFSKLDGYNLIAIHRTFLTNLNIFNEFIDYIKKDRDKWIIIFSGGNTQNTILLNGRQLNISSSDFYTERLTSFIEEFCKETDLANPLLSFLYGQSWRLTLLLQYRYLLWEYENLEEIDEYGDDIDISKEEEIRTTLWTDGDYHTLEEVSDEIGIEKNKRQNR
jgi:hypothetical protein